MALSKTQIIACSQLSGMGRVRVLALADEAEKQQVELKNAAELAEFISHCRETKNVKNLNVYDKENDLSKLIFYESSDKQNKLYLFVRPLRLFRYFYLNYILYRDQCL